MLIMVIGDHELTIWRRPFQRGPMCSKLYTGTLPTVRTQRAHTWSGWWWWWWCHVFLLDRLALWRDSIQWGSISPSHWRHPHHLSHYNCTTAPNLGKLSFERIWSEENTFLHRGLFPAACGLQPDSAACGCQIADQTYHQDINRHFTAFKCWKAIHLETGHPTNSGKQNVIDSSF